MCIACLLICQSVEVLLDLKVDGARWRICEEILQLLRIHVEISLDA